MVTCSIDVSTTIVIDMLKIYGMETSKPSPTTEASTFSKMYLTWTEWNLPTVFAS